MQTRIERERLHQHYAVDDPASPRAVLVGCAVGLCAVATVAGAALLTDSDPVNLGERLQSERARVAVTHAATEHQREVFVARQDQFDKRSAPSVYASAAAATAGR
ncbi:MAG: hypothetical protein ACM3SS_21065 [Rhodospirillaceae bacterium]